MANVLIVEDDSEVLGMLELMLATEGFTTETVVDGSAALERLDGPPADLVLLDIMMPGVDGFAVLRELRAHPRWSRTPVVVVSACAGDEDVWTGWQTGADHYLIKPFDLSDLRDVAVQLLGAGQVPAPPLA